MSKREVTQKLRSIAIEKYTLESVAKLLRSADKNHDGLISKTEGFNEILREMRIQLNAQETRTALRILNATDEGFKIDTFIEFLSPEISEARIKTIEKAFSHLNPDSSGNVKIDDLVNSLSKDGYVNFMGRKMTTKHFREQISKCFDPDRDGIIQKSSFSAYFQEFSQFYPDDQEWNEFMDSLWAEQ